MVDWLIGWLVGWLVGCLCVGGSAQLGGHVSSSTLNAHQMACASEPVDSGGSDVWDRLHDGDADQSYFWNRRTFETTWRTPLGVEVVWVGEMSAGKVLWYWNQVTGVFSSFFKGLKSLRSLKSKLAKTPGGVFIFAFFFFFHF